MNLIGKSRRKCHRMKMRVHGRGNRTAVRTLGFLATDGTRIKHGCGDLCLSESVQMNDVHPDFGPNRAHVAVLISIEVRGRNRSAVTDQTQHFRIRVSSVFHPWLKFLDSQTGRRFDFPLIRVRFAVVFAGRREGRKEIRLSEQDTRICALAT